MKFFNPVVIQYEDLIPSDNEGYIESYKREQETLARIEDIKFKALCRGQFLKLKASARDLEKTFIQLDRPKRVGDPAYKLSELKQMNEAYKRSV